jgi:hypothetical protein
MRRPSPASKSLDRERQERVPWHLTRRILRESAKLTW